MAHGYGIGAGRCSGDQLVIEWNEMYSIGSGNVGATHYANLPRDGYQFHVAAVIFRQHNGD